MQKSVNRKSKFASINYRGINSNNLKASLKTKRFPKRNFKGACCIMSLKYVRFIYFIKMPKKMKIQKYTVREKADKLNKTWLGNLVKTKQKIPTKTAC